MSLNLDTKFLERCLQALEKSLFLLNKADKAEIEYDMYRSACVKEFEIILEQTGKLLKKCLVPYFHSSRVVDGLYFKDIFRQAAKHGLISTEEAERWLEYRDNRNTTTHDYGEGFAEKTLILLPQFILDAQSVVAVIRKS